MSQVAILHCGSEVEPHLDQKSMQELSSSGSCHSRLQELLQVQRVQPGPSYDHPSSHSCHSYQLCHSCLSQGAMMTAQVMITGPGGQRTQARALIDLGAAMTLVSSRITQRINLPLTKANLAFTGIQGTPCKVSKHLTTFVTSSSQVDQTQVTLPAAAVVQKVTDDLPGDFLN